MEIAAGTNSRDRPLTIKDMKNPSYRLVAALVVAAVTIFCLNRSVAQTNYSITPNGLSGYFVNGTNNATLTLYRGITYIFNVNASGHPFFIKTNATTGTTDQYTNGVANNGVQIGTLTFVVPTNTPATLFYHCSVHATMGGTLNMSDIPPPPNVKVVYISVGQSVVTMQSTGTNTWTAIPQFSSNLVSGTWANVLNYTNAYAAGTNTMTFNRLDPICGSNVFLRVHNQFP